MASEYANGEHWSVEDIALDRVDVERVRPREELFLLRAGASFVESATDLYTRNLADQFEGDPEVSEAVDFARYHARESLGLAALTASGSVTSAPLGTVVVTPPWNFPFSILVGGVLAALAAGNAVILKPALQSVRTAWLVARC